MRSIYRLLFVSLALCTFVFETNPVPHINSPLVPLTAAPGSAGFELTVNGFGFVASSVVNWNGSPRATTFVSASQLQATILSTDLATSATAAVTVSSPAPGGGLSNVAAFNVTLPSPAVQYTSTGSNVNSSCTATVQFPQLLADFNSDGKLDVVGTYCGGGFIYVSLGNGDGTFQAPISTAVVPPNPGSFVAADFNGDGKTDLAFVANENTVQILLGNGDGTFQAAKNFLVGVNPYTLVAGDVNGDGKLDLVFTSQTDNDVDVLLGNGDGTFQPYIASFTGGVDPFGVALADFNGDGKLDVAVTETNSSEVTVMLGNGDGTFTYNQDYFVNGYTISPVDINGDGKIDLLGIGVGLGGGYSTIMYMLGNGDGTFQAPVLFATPYNTGYYSAVGAADLNGDGKLDLWATGTAQGGNAIFTLLGNGDGTFQTPQTYISPEGLSLNYPPLEGDFNNDGKPDFVYVGGCGSQYCTVVSLQSPVVTSVTALNFGTKLIGHASTQPVTLTNAGQNAVSISTITFSGTYAKDFSQTNNCPASLASEASCTIQVSFVASTENFLETATLSITDSASSASLQVALSGEGTYIRESPPSLSFGNVAVGQSSSKTVTLTNTGKNTLEVTKIYVGTSPFGKEFSETNTCGNSIAKGASCTITVTFAPTQTGHASAKIDINLFGDVPPPIQVTGSGT